MVNEKLKIQTEIIRLDTLIAFTTKQAKAHETNYDEQKTLLAGKSEEVREEKLREITIAWEVALKQKEQFKEKKRKVQNFVLFQSCSSSSFITDVDRLYFQNNEQKHKIELIFILRECVAVFF